MRRWLIFGFLRLARWFRAGLSTSENAYQLLFLRGFEEWRWRIGKWKAWLVFEHARKHTPAYKDFLHQFGEIQVRLDVFDPDFSQIPIMDKENYVKKYSIEARCTGGKLPDCGVVIDESSGTSGVPNNWVRGFTEREAVKKMLQLSLHKMFGQGQIILINAFALGPWATGMNVSMSLADVTILKSTGPDIAKIVNTLRIFGTHYRYLIVGYPPFLKALLDTAEINWKEYSISVVFGGEGMSEQMRKYLSDGFERIIGSYGASDLEINMGTENEFTIGLRNYLMKDEQLAKRLLLDNHRVTPMIFQYNPLDYYIESNVDNELVVTLCRSSNVAPKVRYNIHDVGHVLRIPELFGILDELQIDVSKIGVLETDLPLLFCYGRSDMTVAFYGCKISPHEIQEVICSISELVRVFNSFSLIVEEDDEVNKRLTIAIELLEGLEVDVVDRLDCEIRLLGRLREINQDFREAEKMIPEGLEPDLMIYGFGEGPFEIEDIRLKKHYIQKKRSMGSV